jgi:hypothetical protein
VAAAIVAGDEGKMRPLARPLYCNTEETTTCLDMSEVGEAGMGIWWREEELWGYGGGRRTSDKENACSVEKELLQIYTSDMKSLDGLI